MPLAGRKFGKLVVLKETSPDVYACKCDCGRRVELFRSLLVCGVSRDCGSEEHGHRGRPLQNYETRETKALARVQLVLVYALQMPGPESN